MNQVPQVRFWGVRGSFPLSTSDNGRYGSNTSSVSIHVPGEPLVLLDLGTGVALLQDALATGTIEPPSAIAALVTHLHLDHIHGLPFFEPAHQDGFRVDVFGPRQSSGSLQAAVATLVGPPLFPLPLHAFAAKLTFHEVEDQRFQVGDLRITVRPVPHRGPTVGYRIEGPGFSVAYVSDHQQPRVLSEVAASVLALAQGADLLIHEAQFTQAEFEGKERWGHCTVEYSVEVARQSRARTLCLFHHDPRRRDDEVDQMLEQARSQAGPDLEVMAAFEGLTIDL